MFAAMARSVCARFHGPPADGHSEMFNVIRSRYLTPVVVASSLFVLVGGCSSIERLATGDKVDYRSSSVTTKTLDVPPDLTQLNRDPRFQAPGGSVSASAFESSASAVAPAGPSGPPITVSAAPSTAPAVTAAASDEARIERAGSQRWLATRLTPEQLWPQLRTFWQERGFNLVVDEPATGVMETDWAEDRAKLPNDLLRNTLGRLIESFYSTGERDKFRTRVERTPSGSEVYISHRGLVEVYVGMQRDTTMWQPRPADAQLEATFLSRLTQKLNAKEDTKTAAAKPVVEATPVAARARLIEDAPGAAMQIDEGFERAWRRVGLALDRTGFTVEDRDRSGGLYFVRYVDPAQAGKEEPGFFSRMFSGSGKSGSQTPARYRIAVKASGDRTTVSVLDAQGAPESSEIGKRIVALLVEDLK